MSVCTDGTCGLPQPKRPDLRAVPPYDPALPDTHPCFAANAALGLCDAAQPRGEVLALRSARCSEERKELMVCLTRARRAA